MKLYDVPRNTRVKLPCGTELFFCNIDGAYSYCITKDSKVVHIAAWQEVEIIEEK